MRCTALHIQRAAKLLRTIQFATLATVSSEGEPWNSPVWAMHDASLNIYWFSDKESQHSRNLCDKAKVFIVIYDSTYPDTVPTGQRNGVYIKALAHEVADPKEVLRIRHMKKGAEAEDPSLFLGKAARRVYVAVPQRFWINDVEMNGGTFVRDCRIELRLDDLMDELARQQGR